MSLEKEVAVKTAKYEKCSVVLLDVAGTTTSLQFVKETLFPYANEHVEDYLKDNWSSNEVTSAIKLLQEEPELDVDAAVVLVKKMSEEKSTNKGFKSIQSLLYKKGYEDGTLKAHIYSDVKDALENWSKERKIAIYSTGTIDSQKLLFAHTTEGDLTTYISAYFDQSVGVKTESHSYTAICEQLNVKPEETLFISDDAEETSAAEEAKLQTALIKRETESQESSSNLLIINSFADILLSSNNKRKGDEVLDDQEVPPAKIAKTENTKVLETEQKPKDEIDLKCHAVLNSEIESMDVDLPSEDQIVDSKTDSEKQTDSEDKTLEIKENLKELKPTEQDKITENIESNSSEVAKTNLVNETEDTKNESQKSDEKLAEPTEPIKNESSQVDEPMETDPTSDHLGDPPQALAQKVQETNVQETKDPLNNETIKTENKTEEVESIPKSENKIEDVEIAQKALEESIEVAQEATEPSVLQVDNELNKLENSSANVEELINSCDKLKKADVECTETKTNEVVKESEDAKKDTIIDEKNMDTSKIENKSIISNNEESVMSNVSAAPAVIVPENPEKQEELTKTTNEAETGSKEPELSNKTEKNVSQISEGQKLLIKEEVTKKIEVESKPIENVSELSTIQEALPEEKNEQVESCTKTEVLITSTTEKSTESSEAQTVVSGESSIEISEHNKEETQVSDTSITNGKSDEMKKESLEHSLKNSINQNGSVQNGTEMADIENGTPESATKCELIKNESVENGKSKASVSSEGTECTVGENVENVETTTDIVVKKIENVESPSVTVEA